jgi:hypothetical protein
MDETNNSHNLKNNKFYLTLDIILMLIIFIQIVAFIGVGYEEDVYISFRYALNLIRGNGLVYNVGERVEGFSNPSWTLLLALLKFIGLPFRFSAFMMAVVFDLVIFYLLRKISIHLYGNTLLARIPLFMLASFSYFHASFGNGLEGSIWCLSLVILMMGAVYLNKNIILCSSLITLVTRPEGIFVYGISLTYLIYLIVKEKKYNQIKPYIGIFISLGIVLVLFSIRYTYYHDYLPNPVWSKTAKGNFNTNITSHFIIGYKYYLKYLKTIGIFNIALLILGYFSILKKDLVVFCFSLILLNAGLVINNSGDWMLYYRLLTPYFPLYAILITASVITFTQKIKLNPSIIFSIFILVNIIQLNNIRLLFNSLKDLKGNWIKAWSIDPAEEYYTMIGNDKKRITVKDIMQPNEKIVLEAGGRQGYILNRFYVIEMHGLTDKDLINKDNPYTYLAPTWGKVNWIEMFKKNPDYFYFISPGHLVNMYYIPGIKDELAHYIIFQAEGKHILLMRKDNVNISKFQIVYTYYDVDYFVNNVLSQYYPGLTPPEGAIGSQLIREGLYNWQISQGNRVFTHANNYISVNQVAAVYKDKKPMKLILDGYPAKPGEAGVYYSKNWPQGHRIYINDGKSTQPTAKYEIAYRPTFLWKYFTEEMNEFESAEFYQKNCAYLHLFPELYVKTQERYDTLLKTLNNIIGYEMYSGISYIGYSVKKEGIEKYRMFFIFRINGPIEKDWMLYMHGKVADKDVTRLPLNRQQDKSDSWDFRPVPPTSQWPKQGYLIISREMTAKPIPYEIELGFYRIGEGRYGKSAKLGWVDLNAGIGKFQPYIGSQNIAPLPELIKFDIFKLSDIRSDKELMQSNSSDFIGQIEKRYNQLLTKYINKLGFAVNTAITFVEYAIKKEDIDKYKMYLIFRINGRIEKDWILYVHGKIAEQDITRLPVNQQQNKSVNWDFRPDPLTSQWPKQKYIIISREITAKPIRYEIELGFYRIREGRFGKTIQLGWVDLKSIK